jgi:hypothetical protein
MQRKQQANMRAKREIYRGNKGTKGVLVLFLG